MQCALHGQFGQLSPGKASSRSTVITMHDHYNYDLKKRKLNRQELTLAVVPWRLDPGKQTERGSLGFSGVLAVLFYVSISSSVLLFYVSFSASVCYFMCRFLPPFRYFMCRFWLPFVILCVDFFFLLLFCVPMAWPPKSVDFCSSSVVVRTGLPFHGMGFDCKRLYDVVFLLYEPSLIWFWL